MVRCGPKSGLVVLLLAGLVLLPEVMAQTVPQSVQKTAPAAASPPQAKPHARHKKAAPDPPAPVTPAPPPTLAESSPTPPQVTYNNGQLTIVAQNATLSQVLRSVQALTGASVDMPSSASSERVVGQLGPGRPRDVLNALLNGTKFNYIILGVTGNPGAVQKIILTAWKPASATVNTAQNNPAPQAEEPQEAEENYGEPEPQPNTQTPLPPQFRHRPGMPGRMPEGFVQPQMPQPQPSDSSSAEENQQVNGGKTPEQLLQELQQMQQQQQQMQEQLNPANRQPQPQPQ